MKSQQSGFAHAFLIIGLVVALIGALGFVFWQSFIYKEPVATKVKVVKSDSDNKSAELEDTYEPTIPEGWVVRENDGPAFSYAVPSAQAVTYNGYKTEEMIHVGYGAPVYVTYSSSSAWETYDNDENNKPTVKRADNLVNDVEAKVENKYDTAFYNTGDGVTGESRVLIVVNDKVYQLSFAGKIQTEEFINTFVKTIKIE